MRTIEVYQCELNKTIPLEYIGRVKYIGETFGVDGLTDQNDYDIVRDEHGALKVVDNSQEDYLYDLGNPRPANGESKGGRFEIIDDFAGVLKKYIK